jgi:hypothetical protein
VPSAASTLTIQVASSLGPRVTNAMRRPSGDHAGLDTLVTCKPVLSIG